MGTSYRVKIADAQAADEAPLRAEIEAVLADVDRRLSTYRQDSEISRFNRAPAEEWFAVSPATAEIVAAAQKLNRESEGALDVTVGPLVRLWHFGPDTIAKAESPAEIAPPQEAAWQMARAVVGHQHLAVRHDPPALRKQIAGLEVDLSSVGEGYAIDQLAAAVERHGHKNFLVELGGEVRASGHGPSGKPWRIAIARPDESHADTAQIVELSNAAVATSGDYHRYFEYNGRRYSHIIDPATGRPIEHKLAAVTVAADSALVADAWDTALLVLGPERGYECAVKRNLAALFIARSGDQIAIRETPAWQERFVTAARQGPAGRRTRSP